MIDIVTKNYPFETKKINELISKNIHDISDLELRYKLQYVYELFLGHRISESAYRRTLEDLGLVFLDSELPNNQLVIFYKTRTISFEDSLKIIDDYVGSPGYFGDRFSVKDVYLNDDNSCEFLIDIKNESVAENYGDLLNRACNLIENTDANLHRIIKGFSDAKIKQA